ITRSKIGFRVWRTRAHRRLQHTPGFVFDLQWDSIYVQLHQQSYREPREQDSFSSHCDCDKERRSIHWPETPQMTILKEERPSDTYPILISTQKATLINIDNEYMQNHSILNYLLTISSLLFSIHSSLSPLCCAVLSIRALTLPSRDFRPPTVSCYSNLLPYSAHARKDVAAVCDDGLFGGNRRRACRKKKSEPKEEPKVDEEKEEVERVKPPKPKCKVQPKDGDGNQFGECEKHGTSGWDFVMGDWYLCTTKTRDLTYLDRGGGGGSNRGEKAEKKQDPKFFDLPPKAD
uniref:Uncharacterized protein n=1 Tax=Pristionchus pacificus TaxID=54126 RepID=A0A4X3NXP5_PRIPA